MKTYLVAIVWQDNGSYTNLVEMPHELAQELSDRLAGLQEDGVIKWYTVHQPGPPITKSALLRDLYIHAIDMK